MQFIRNIPKTLILFSILYGIFLYKQYIDIFFEAQFLHINFLIDLSKKQFQLNHFLTTYGEHLFPGYNLILFLNYYIFNIDTLFEFSLYWIGLFFSVYLINFYINKRRKLNSNIISFYIALILFSTTLNPSSGMALSASIGVVFFIIYLYFFTIKINEESSIEDYAVLLFLLILSCNFFLGGYSVGVYLSVLTCIIINIYKNNYKITGYFIINTFILLVSLIIYIYITSRYGNLTSSAPDTDSFSLIGLLKFILGMGGASLLGKSFYEANGNILVYYYYGFLLYLLSLYIFFKIIKTQLKNSDYFLVAILIYSMVNILFVSFFRYKNGAEASLGQWYNIHTRFIVLFVLYYLSLESNRSLLKKIIFRCFIIIIITGALIGYYYDWRKAKYIPEWKNQFINQVPSLLLDELNPSYFESTYDSMLWDYPSAKKGIEFLYENNLSIFKKKIPLIFGIKNRNTEILHQKVALICPSGTKNIKFELRDHLQRTSQKNYFLNSDKQIHLESNDFGKYSYTLNNSKPIIYINYRLSGEGSSKRIAVLSTFSCDGISGLSTSDYSSIRVEDWGPKTMSLRSPLPNLQPDGSMGLWVKIHNNIDEYSFISINMDGRPLLAPVIGKGLITVGIPAEGLRNKGLHPIELKRGDGENIKIGDILIDD